MEVLDLEKRDDATSPRTATFAIKLVGAGCKFDRCESVGARVRSGCVVIDPALIDDLAGLIDVAE
jgi:hypothetical protein